MDWNGCLSMMHGQQRITSFARFVNKSWPFAVEWKGNIRYFDSLDKDEQDTLTHPSFADDSFADTLASANIAIYKAQISYSEDVDRLWRNYIEGKTS